MKNFKYLILPLAMMLLYYFTGCAENTAPDTSQSVAQTDIVSGAIESDLELLKDAGVTVHEGHGVFSLGWHDIMGPIGFDGEVHGSAFVIVYENSFSDHPPFLSGGIDIGVVKINYSGKSVALYKHITSEGGIFYTLFSGPFGFTDRVLEFIPNTEYEFEISGSDRFSPLTFTRTSPGQLINISNLTPHQVINPAEDLHIEWTGGSEAGIGIHLVPFFGPWIDGTDGGPMNNDGDHFPGRFWERFRHLHRFGSFHEGFFSWIDYNTGGYIIPSGTLQDLISNYDANKLILGVGQANPIEIEHDGSVYYSLMRVGDGLILDL